MTGLSSSVLRRIAGFGVVVVLAACGSSGDKIGATVKGQRIAVISAAKNAEPDQDLKTDKPQPSPMTPNINWSQAGFDATHVLPNAGMADHPQEIWREDIGKGSGSDYKLLARPVVNNGMLFTCDSVGHVSAFDAVTGDERWDVDTTPEDRDAKAMAGGLAAEGDTVFVTTGFGEVLALSAHDGHVLWRRALQNPLRAAPSLAAGRLYVVSIDNQLTALEAASGHILWQHHGLIENAALMGASNPAVTGDSVIVAYSSGELFDLRTENGRVSWNYALSNPTQTGAMPAIADIRGLPVVDHGHVYAISHSGRMVAIDQRTGDREWEIDVGGINTPVVSGDTVFVQNNEGQLVAIKRDSGRIFWLHDLQKLTDPEDHASDPVHWFGPVLGGNRLWLTNTLGQLVSFSVNDGSAMETIDIGKPGTFAPIIANGILYVVTENGKVTALR